MDDIKAMLGKKDKETDSLKKESKLKALMGLKKMLSDMDGDEVKGIRKVTVAAPDKEGLEQGLDKAKEIVEDPMEMAEEAAGEDLDEDMEEGESEEHKEAIAEGGDDISSIEEAIRKLEEKKKALQSK